MGEMADYFLEQVEAAEWRRSEYLNGDVSDEDAFEEGLIDHEGFTTFDPDRSYVVPKDIDGIDSEIRIASLELSNNGLSNNGLGHNGFGRNEPFLDTRRVSSSFNITTLRFLHGFAKYYNQHKFLSDKQKAIVDTNWKGGWQQFIRDVETNDIENKLKKLIETGEIT